MISNYFPSGFCHKLILVKHFVPIVAIKKEKDKYENEKCCVINLSDEMRIVFLQCSSSFVSFNLDIEGMDLCFICRFSFLLHVVVIRHYK